MACCRMPVSSVILNMWAVSRTGSPQRHSLMHRLSLQPLAAGPARTGLAGNSPCTCARSLTTLFPVSGDRPVFAWRAVPHRYRAAAALRLRSLQDLRTGQLRLDRLPVTPSRANMASRSRPSPHPAQWQACRRRPAPPAGRGNVDIRCANMFNQFLCAHKTIHEDQARRHTKLFR